MAQVDGLSDRNIELTYGISFSTIDQRHCQDGDKQASLLDLSATKVESGKSQDVYLSSSKYGLTFLNLAVNERKVMLRSTSTASSLVALGSN